jgi:histidyl-tRNA synthetase
MQTEMLYKKNPKLLNQFQYSEREGVPLLVILGEEETARGGVKIRDTRTRQDVRVLFYVYKPPTRGEEQTFCSEINFLSFCRSL